MAEPELKRCPFCGSDSVYLTCDSLEEYHWVQCDECACEGPWESLPGHAVFKWNTRVNEEPTDE